MFGSLSGIEILVILALALLLFGPRRLPQIGRTMGKALSEFRRATNDFRASLEREVDVEQLRETKSSLQSLQQEARQVVRDANPLSEPAERKPQPRGGPRPDAPGSDDVTRQPGEADASLDEADGAPAGSGKDGADERDAGTT